MIPFEDQFEEVFYFVSDVNLRKHLGDALRYATELETINTKGAYPESISSTFYKTSTVYFASIIEAVLHFCLKEMKFEHYKKNWEYNDVKIIHSIDEDNEIVWCKRNRKKVKIDGFIEFAALNKFCKDEAKLYGGNLYKEIDEMRDLRNKIHLMRLSEIDREFKKQKAEKAATVTNKVLDIVERKLKSKTKFKIYSN